MRAAYLLIRFARYLSLLLFVALLLLSYYYLPKSVAIHFSGTTNQADGYLDKSTFFYACGIFIVVFNFLISWASKLMLVLPPRLVAVLNRRYWLADRDNRREFREILQDWLSSLGAIVNGFLILCLYAILRINTSSQLGITNYTWLPLVGAGVLLVWMVALPLRLLVRRNALLG